MRVALIFLAVVASGPAQEQFSFDGTWLLRVNGQNILKLTLQTKNGVVAGSLVRPSQFNIDQDGDFSDIGPDQETLAVQKSEFRAGQLDLTIDDDHYVMIPIDKSHASLALEFVRPWNLERVPDGSQIVLATKLAQPDYPEKIVTLRKRLREMVKDEQEARMAFNMKRMEAEDEKNRPEVLRIFDEYGWVTKSLAGKDAAHDFWLLVQHQTPEIQRRLLPALEKAAKNGDASMSDYAYLYDRVQMGLDKPQHWGSQVKCQDGKPALYPVDDAAGLDARRKELFMPPIGEYLAMDYIVKACAAEKLH